MNVYRHSFTAKCPNNGQTILYRLTIEAEHVLMVEDIMTAVRRAAIVPKPYHENMADVLHAHLGGRHRMIAFHHGVHIETIRG